MDSRLVTREQFDELVDQAAAVLPEWVEAAMKDVAIMVEDLPPPDDATPGLLLGRYHGVPLAKRGFRYPGSMPDIISLYRINILTVCRDIDQVAERISQVLLHEIGHAMGLSEGRLRELGVG
jgi:predicted Zn-dependent protease with MMP-like domain